uniref:Uncharacterized protein n=1 Tax=Steinernema glaseri TaxID=37863 RepID=A0A1I7ZZ85_9BILA
MICRAVVSLLVLISEVLASRNVSKAILLVPEVEEFHKESLKLNLTSKVRFSKVAERFPDLLCFAGDNCDELHKWIREKELVTSLDHGVIIAVSITLVLLLAIAVGTIVHSLVSCRIPSYRRPKYQNLLNGFRRIKKLLESERLAEKDRSEMAKLVKELFEARYDHLQQSDHHKKAFPLDFHPDTNTTVDEQLKRVFYGDPKNKPVQLNRAQEANDDI